MSKGISWGPGFRSEPFRNALGPAQHLHLILERTGGITSTEREAGERGSWISRWAWLPLRLVTVASVE